MALYGNPRDISLMRHLAKELISKIVSTEVIFHKISLNDTKTNAYGESKKKFYYPGVILNTLTIKQSQTTNDADFGPDGEQLIEFRFLKYDLIQTGIEPNNGDIIMYRNIFYEIDNTNEQQFLFEKIPEYSLSDATKLQGESWTISCETHQTRAIKLDILRQNI